MPDVHQPAPVVRLSVNLAPDVAEALKGLAAQQGISITEGIRRAIAIWNFVEGERARGNRFVVVEERRGKRTEREVVLIG